ncbi:hypothetical protein B0H67DRAFT_583402 [Lasiosphaeris hirsuta]|uniref:Uncharacterized protein n=1 Tax=Lasiosphaeris hirsuta TaxID=260670 RepID=A0AA40A7N8_9PEZI|nr:hypothetical protein B0H67DRAFT_583402 [Lasiosphaeris hirsuta]
MDSKSTMAMAKRVLFFTNSDFGQANVVLTTAHALIHVVPGIEIHIASFVALEVAVNKTSDFALGTAPQSIAKTPITFHRLNGISWGSATFRPEVGVAEANDLTPGLINSAKVIFLIPSIMLPWRRTSSPPSTIKPQPSSPTWTPPSPSSSHSSPPA